MKTYMENPGKITLDEMMEKCGVTGNPIFAWLEGSPDEHPHTPAEVVYTEIGDSFILEYDNGICNKLTYLEIIE